MAVSFVDVRGTAYKTTFVVDIQTDPSEYVEYHTHYSIGDRVEGGIRQIAFATHWIGSCQYREIFHGALANRADISALIYCGFPIEQVSDWTEQEADIFSQAFCPETPSAYDRAAALVSEAAASVEANRASVEANRTRVEANRARDDVILPWGNWADDEEEPSTQPHKNEEDENFPVEFDDDNECPVCREESYNPPNCLLCLPCRHTLCKACWKVLSAGDDISISSMFSIDDISPRCPKCRHAIDKALIKTKKT